MCLLCVIQPGVTPTREQLYTAAESNPHGFGYAFLTNDKIITGRGMDAEDVIERFLRIREGLTDCYAMFHARFTTHGSTNKSNCHPFRVGGDEDIVLGHNGILPLDPADNRSDTRMFAEDWLPELGVESLDDPTMFAELERWAGSKVAVFSLSPKLQKNVYILNEHMGHWDKGIWWSNYSYEPYVSCSPSKYAAKPRWYDEIEDCEAPFYDPYDECSYCRMSDTINREFAFCTNCLSCADCYEDLSDCLCYKPNFNAQSAATSNPVALQNAQSLLPYSDGWAW
jgi:glutamine amidotransferase